jgi:hypothetical protein
MSNAPYLTADATVSARIAAAVTPSDSTVFGGPTRGLYVGVGGNVTVDMVNGGTSITFTNVQPGSLLPIQATRVYSTGTNATSIVALY